MKLSRMDMDDESGQPQVPEEGDFVYDDASSGLSVHGEKFLGTFIEWDDVENAINQYAYANKWFPSVWKISDHGNAHLVEDFSYTPPKVLRATQRYFKKVAQEVVQEHQELLGTPRVMIEPYNTMVNDAVAIVNQTNPDILKQISDIRINLSKGVFGEFESTSPNTIWVNIRKIEDEVRSKLSGQPEEAISAEIINQIASTIIHEATHRHEYAATGFSSESKPEMAEEQFRRTIQQSSIPLSSRTKQS